MVTHWNSTYVGQLFEECTESHAFSQDKKQKKQSKRTGVKDNEKKGKELSKQAATYTKNIVFREVLTD